MIASPDYNFTKDKFCNYCGTPFAEQKLYPRKCFCCGNDTYKNPIPVVVVILEVGDLYHRGILIEQRGIAPKIGEWALPSGYIDLGETWDQAAAREVKEELGLDSKPSDYDLIDITNDTTGHMLIFCKSLLYFTPNDLSKFIPNDEVLAVDVIKAPRDLAFPTHTQMIFNHLQKMEV